MEDQLRQVGFGGAQQGLGAARAVLEMEPDYREPSRLRDLPRHLCRARPAGQGEAEGGGRHELRAEYHEVAPAHPAARDALADRLRPS